MGGNQRLHEAFARLCEIRSPTGEEREVADTLAAELRALGLEVTEDDSAGPAEAGAGNLLARVRGRDPDTWVMFCAHIDTVPHRGMVEVVDDEGVFRSRGETILGADNKAAVAVFMELVRRAVETTPAVGVELVLTVAEEQGLRGAKAFDASVLRSERAFVLDHAGPVGEVVTATPTQQKILADFRGVEAHAGVRPEDGASAIAAAAAAISRMDLGRLDSETTANVGLITGGTSGNVVPGHCAIHAEARSIDAARAAEVAGQISDACAWGASEHGCDVDMRIEELFRGYKVPSGSAALALAEESLRAIGVEPVRASIGGGSDANVFRLDGMDCVLLANGPDAVHTADEHIAVADLDRMLAVCEGIVARAGSLPAGGLEADDNGDGRGEPGDSGEAETGGDGRGAAAGGDSAADAPDTESK